MNKLFFILFISVFVSKFNIIAQITLRNDDILKLTIENFPESIYYKALKTRPEIQTSLSSAKTIDSGCISYQTKEFNFKKEKISFRFTNNYDTTKKHYVVTICINGKRAPFMTEDSIKFGDKILLTNICKDINKLKAQYATRNDKYVKYVFYNNITYIINKTHIENINAETVVEITEINIRVSKY